MDWIHCNSCFVQPNENGAKLKFYLTSCGHLFCENCGCFAGETTDSCKQCMNKCSSALIGEKSFQMNPQVLEYFQEPEIICEKLIKVMKFQKAHRIKLVEHHQRVISKYNRAKLYIKKLENELKICKNALQNTPPKQHSITHNHSISMPVFHPNSSAFKMINSEAKHLNSLNMKQNLPDMRHRKPSFRNDLSLIMSSVSTSGVHRSPTSSVYASPLQENCDEKNIPSINNLHLNSFGSRQFRKN